MTRTNVHVAVAEELTSALRRLDIDVYSCVANPCGHITITFAGIEAASDMLMLAIPAGGPGSLRDRACSGFVSFSDKVESGAAPSMEEAMKLSDTGWAWATYPDFDPQAHQVSHVVWNIAVDLPVDDAATVTAALNSVPVSKL